MNRAVERSKTRTAERSVQVMMLRGDRSFDRVRLVPLHRYELGCLHLRPLSSLVTVHPYTCLHLRLLVPAGRCWEPLPLDALVCYRDGAGDTVTRCCRKPRHWGSDQFSSRAKLFTACKSIEKSWPLIRGAGSYWDEGS